jgi:hypothetical protein
VTARKRSTKVRVRGRGVAPTPAPAPPPPPPFDIVGFPSVPGSVRTRGLRSLDRPEFVLLGVPEELLGLAGLVLAALARESIAGDAPPCGQPLERLDEWFAFRLEPVGAFGQPAAEAVRRAATHLELRPPTDAAQVTIAAPPGQPGALPANVTAVLHTSGPLAGRLRTSGLQEHHGLPELELANVPAPLARPLVLLLAAVAQQIRQSTAALDEPLSYRWSPRILARFTVAPTHEPDLWRVRLLGEAP